MLPDQAQSEEIATSEVYQQYSAEQLVRENAIGVPSRGGLRIFFSAAVNIWRRTGAQLNLAKRFWVPAHESVPKDVPEDLIRAVLDSREG